MAQYVDLIGGGSIDAIVEMFADGATVEDPVGSEVRAGRVAIREFYSALRYLDRSCEMTSVRVSGNEAAFEFTLTFYDGDRWVRLSLIDTVVFDASGNIMSLRSYYSPTDFEPVDS